MDVVIIFIVNLLMGKNTKAKLKHFKHSE